MNTKKYKRQDPMLNRIDTLMRLPRRESAKLHREGIRLSLLQRIEEADCTCPNCTQPIAPSINSWVRITPREFCVKPRPTGPLEAGVDISVDGFIALRVTKKVIRKPVLWCYLVCRNCWFSDPKLRACRKRRQNHGDKLVYICKHCGENKERREMINREKCRRCYARDRYKGRREARGLTVKRRVSEQESAPKQTQERMQDQDA